MNTWTETRYCKNCKRIVTVDKLVFRQRARMGLSYDCPACGASDLTTNSERTKPKYTDNKKRSVKQEKRVAAREGGRAQPGSGAVDGFEGDVRKSGKYRGECKFTRAASYTLKLADLKKLEAQASSGELPVFDVEFQSEKPVKRYVIVPEWVFDTLMTESGRREG